MNETARRPQHTFIVRLWAESATGTAVPAPAVAAAARWRGSVEQVPSAQRLYFTSLDDLIDFLIFQSGWNQEPEHNITVKPSRG
jgi:hypothetical protein